VAQEKGVAGVSTSPAGCSRAVRSRPTGGVARTRGRTRFGSGRARGIERWHVETVHDGGGSDAFVRPRFFGGARTCLLRPLGFAGASRVGGNTGTTVPTITDESLDDPPS
jgi:hypothetical protein